MLDSRAVAAAEKAYDTWFAGYPGLSRMEAAIAAYISRVSPSPERDTVRLVEALRERVRVANLDYGELAAETERLREALREATGHINHDGLRARIHALLAESPDAPARDARGDTVAVVPLDNVTMDRMIDFLAARAGFALGTTELNLAQWDMRACLAEFGRPGTDEP